MVVKRSSSLVETARMPGIRKTEKLKVEMVAEFVTQGAQECTVRGDLFAHCCPHPNANQHCFRVIISKEFCRPIFANSQWPCREHPDSAGRDFIEICSNRQKLGAGLLNIWSSGRLHCGFETFNNVGQQPFCGRSRFLVRSLFRNSTRLPSRGGASVSI